MEIIENKYTIQRIKNTQDKIYTESLRIYNDNTPPDIKTNTNEITYWINKNRTNTAFEVIPFALLIDSQIVGFLMVSYLKINKTIIIEYIALLEQYRVNVVFFSFMNLMKNYFGSLDYDVRYYIVEISNKNDGKSIDKESQFFMKFLCLEGYGRIDAEYKTLPLGIKECESSFNAFLYIKTNDLLKTISKRTYVDLVHEIYFNYFLNWYKYTMPKQEFESYQAIVSDQYTRLKEELRKFETLNISYSSCSMFESPLIMNTHIPIPSKIQSKKIITIPMYFLIVLILPVAIVTFYSRILPILGVDIKLINTMIGPIFTSIATATITLWVARKRS